MTESVFSDLASYVTLPRLTDLALSADGRRLVAAVQQPDDEGAKYVSSLWEIPLSGAAGAEPVRLTRSTKGETAPAFLPDGTLLFVSARPAGDKADEDEPAIWALPPHGEPELRAHRAGGLRAPVVARDSGMLLATGSRLAGSTDADDAARRSTRKDRKITAILHDGMPIRHWDHELGDEQPRLLLLGSDAEQRDLAPDATFELVESSQSITADGATVATSWRTRGRAGYWGCAVVLITTATGKRRTLAGADGWRFENPVIAPDGRYVAMGLERDGTFDTPLNFGLAVARTSDGERRPVALGDLTPTEWVWSADSSMLFVAGDLHGRGAVVAVDPASGDVRYRLASDACYDHLRPAADGSAVYALRSAWDCPPAPVRLHPTAPDQPVTNLPSPAPKPELPGRLIELAVPAGDALVHSWLCLPDRVDPAPVMLWIHGGPFGSYNAWSWRWNPWVAVARGWAVVLPDPALSTGYGQACIDRAWPYLADVVWAELESVLDAVLDMPEVDASRVACLGASFGGFMTNWIAGHTDRFGAIVTHAGLWALDQQHATTDAAYYKTGIFGTREEHPDWYAAYSPHNFVEKIRTPMLVSHGNRDYRVPVSEALRLWWDLVHQWDGDPAALPHRFLQLTGENHWVLSPANAEIWYDTVLGFCAEHVLGQASSPSSLL